MGEGIHITVLRIATLVLLISCQSCGSPQEYVETPGPFEEGLGNEMLPDYHQPVGVTPRKSGSDRSTIQENDKVLRVACTGASQQLLSGTVKVAFESSHPGSRIRIFDHRVDFGLQELIRGNLDLMLTSKPLSYAHKRQGLRQKAWCYRTWDPAADRVDPRFDVYVTYRVDCKGAAMQLKDYLTRFQANIVSQAVPAR